MTKREESSLVVATAGVQLLTTDRVSCGRAKALLHILFLVRVCIGEAMADLLEQLKRSSANRYESEAEIGRGGMAVVFLALDRKLD
jgi:hypothetical protein